MPGATENRLKVVRVFWLNLLLLKSAIPSKPGAFFAGKTKQFQARLFSGQISDL